MFRSAIANQTDNNRIQACIESFCGKPNAEGDKGCAFKPTAGHPHQANGRE
uniref:Uncharacterized protein n=1 Tax=Anopheles atroparvus TaxID=41427 RepID=A0AAG5CP29_ANOAO